jgi:hypothetical protein
MVIGYDFYRTAIGCRSVGGNRATESDERYDADPSSEIVNEIVNVTGGGV